VGDGAHAAPVMRRDAVGGLHLWREVAVGIGRGSAYGDHGLFMPGASFADAMTKGSQGSAAAHRGASDANDGP
jgi:hypothetical protein